MSNCIEVSAESVWFNTAAMSYKELFKFNLIIIK